MSHLAYLSSPSPARTHELGRRLGGLLDLGHVVGLVGELGAGKTALVAGVAEGAGVEPEVYVSSPTFTLINEYPGRLTLYHMDFYRLDDPSDLTEIGADAYFGGDGACLVEWFDRFPEEVPRECLQVTIAVTGPASRRLELSADDPVHIALGHRWASWSEQRDEGGEGARLDCGHGPGK
jgi:tRNA threonylcarbamoyladenosine biosynthesis protein TsaE